MQKELIAREVRTLFRRGTASPLLGIFASAVCAPLASASVFPPEFELAELLAANGGDGRDGFVVLGIEAGDGAGMAVGGAGDVNGDGYDDILIGAPGAGYNGEQRGGQAYLVLGSGSGFPAELPLVNLLAENGGDGSTGVVFHWFEATESLGISVSGAGDLTGDGLADMILGAYGSDAVGFAAGRCYVVFGSAGGFPAEFEVGALHPDQGGDGSQGFIVDGAREENRTCNAATAAGDVNADGTADAIIGAFDAQVSGESLVGRSYFVFGNPQGFPAYLPLRSLFPSQGGDGSVGIALNGVDPSSHAGRWVSGAGDVNGDGIDDAIIGAFGANPHGSLGAGQSYVVFGTEQGFPPVIDLALLLSDHGGDGTGGFALNGASANDHSGYAVSGIGDVNGDGIDDLLTTAGTADGSEPNAGMSYVIYGRTGGFPSEIELALLLPEHGGDGSLGFVLPGINTNDSSGVAASGAGDVNGDGLADLIIGARTADGGGREKSGESYVVFGRAKGFPPVFELASLLAENGGDGTTGFVLNGIGAYDVSGTAVSAAGDVNGDGVGDLLIGTQRIGDITAAGEAYVVFGRRDGDGDGLADNVDNCQLHANADQRDTNGDGYGNVCDPDLNGDGIVNFIDLGQLKRVFLGSYPDADFDGNGIVNFTDLATMKTFFFGAPGPSGLAR